MELNFENVVNVLKDQEKDFDVMGYKVIKNVTSKFNNDEKLYKYLSNVFDNVSEIDDDDMELGYGMVDGEFIDREYDIEWFYNQLTDDYDANKEDFDYKVLE